MKLTKTNLEHTYNLTKSYLEKARDDLLMTDTSGLSQEIALRVAVDAIEFAILSLEENHGNGDNEAIEMSIEDFINDTYTDY